MLSVRETAIVLGLHVNTVRERIHAGDIPAYRLGGKLLIPRSFVDRVTAEPVPVGAA